MKFAFLMDPLESVKAYKDTTYFLMLAARERGHSVFYFGAGSMKANNETVSAVVSEVDVHTTIEKPFTVLKFDELDLACMDAILIRTDPPFDRGYLYSTLLLDLLRSNTVVVNSPTGIRNWNEKLAAMFYPDLTPYTLISNSKREILECAEQMGRLTLKPIDGHGGKGIVFLEVDDPEADEKIEQITMSGKHWVLAQQYLSAAVDGDKRILLVNGDPIGAILRVHAEGVELNNLDQGAVAQPSELSERDLEICKAIKPGLLEQGIFFCGIDIIGGMLMEVNVTSPTGLQELCRFSGSPFHHEIIHQLELKIESVRNTE